jgi:hypothetical protein
VSNVYVYLRHRIYATKHKNIVRIIHAPRMIPAYDVQCFSCPACLHADDSEASLFTHVHTRLVIVVNNCRRPSHGCRMLLGWVPSPGKPATSQPWTCLPQWWVAQKVAIMSPQLLCLRSCHFLTACRTTPLDFIPFQTCLPKYHLEDDIWCVDLAPCLQFVHGLRSF